MYRSLSVFNIPTDWTTIETNNNEVEVLMNTAWQDSRVHEIVERMASLYSEKIRHAVLEVGKVVLGAEMAKISTKLLLLLIARGHALLEAVPGVAKTLVVKSLTDVVDAESVIHQFHEDMLAGDLLGDYDYVIKTVEGGKPIIESIYVPGILPSHGTNIFFADEINRARTKSVSPLLSLMQEGQVIVRGRVTKMPEFFTVFGTLNPLESEVYPLGEAVSDRFTMKIIVPFADPETFLEIQKMTTLAGIEKREKLTSQVGVGDILAMRSEIDEYHRLATPPRDWAEHYGGRRYVNALYNWFKQAPYTKEYSDILRLVPYEGKNQGAVSPRAFLQIEAMAKAVAAFFPEKSHLLLHMASHVQRVVRESIPHRLWFRPGVSQEEQIQHGREIVEKCLWDLYMGTKSSDRGPLVQSGNSEWKPRKPEEFSWDLV